METKQSRNPANYLKNLSIRRHFESDESPEYCVLLELFEGLQYNYLNLEHQLSRFYHFLSSEYPTEYMHVFTAYVIPEFELDSKSCYEGETIAFHIDATEVQKNRVVLLRASRKVQQKC